MNVNYITQELYISKASQLLDIPTKIIKQNADISNTFVYNFDCLIKTWNYVTLLRHLSKAFDYFSHEMIITKLHAYELDMATLRLIKYCLINGTTGVKINDVYRAWLEILFGIPQDPILRPLLFNTSCYYYSIYYFT